MRTRTPPSLGGPLVLAALAALAAPAAVHALPAASTSTYAAIYFPISNPLCAPACVFDPVFSHVADDHYLAEAGAGFGSVGAEITAHEDAYTGGPRFLAESQGAMLDNITITGPTGTGMISFDVELHGSASTTLPGVVDPSITFFFSAQGPTTGARVDVDSALDGFPSQTFTTAAFAYTFGDPITISMGLLAAMLARADGSGAPLIGEILYRNTASMTGLTVLDAEGSPVTDYVVSSESGTSYPLAVPEPGRCWLLVAGGLTLLALRRARRDPRGATLRIVPELGHFSTVGAVLPALATLPRR